MKFSSCEFCVRICPNSKRFFDKAWADDALRLGIRAARGFDFSFFEPRLMLVKYFIKLLRDRGFEWHAKRLASAFYRSLKDGAIFFHGHRTEVNTRPTGGRDPRAERGGSSI